MREIQIIHLQRAGGHALANWLLNQISEKATFANDVCHRDKIGLWRKKRPEISPGTQWMIYNVEDVSLHEIAPRLEKASNFLPILIDPNPIYILVLRDIYNFLASRYRYGLNGNECQLGNLNASVIAAWCQHARTGFYVQHGAGARLTLQQMIVVNFNRWASCRAYRYMLWQSLSRRDDGLPGQFKEDAHEEVPTWGGGSSFDGLDFNGRASQMNINLRHKDMPAKLLSQFVDEESAVLSEAIFGWRL